MTPADTRDAQELFDSERGAFIVCDAISLFRQIAAAAGMGSQVPPDDEIVSRLYSAGSEHMVLRDDGIKTLVAAALLWSSRALEAAAGGTPNAPGDNVIPHSDIADMRLLLTLFTDHVPMGLDWSDLPTGDWQ